jgi:mRNA interferase RelE/StbE
MKLRKSKMTLEQILKNYLAQYKVKVKFSKKAVEDLASFDKNTQEKIIALILKRGQSNPLIKPRGIGEPLQKELYVFSKIKPKHLKLRIVYRSVEKEDAVYMEIIAIGPKDKEKVYKMAIARLMDFKREMGCY